MREAAEERPVWAWIDLAALRHNARRAIACAAGRSVIAVVKADAYGHGAEQVARALLQEGVGRLAVVSVAEGAKLRRAGIMAPILLMGGLDDAALASRAVKWGLTPVLHDVRGLELARRFARTDSPLSVEVEVDTGMRRMGVPRERAPAFLAQLRATPQLVLSGLFSHLACADAIDPEPARAQWALLAEVVDDHVARGGFRPSVHMANSAGLLRLPDLEGKGARDSDLGGGGEWGCGLVTQAVRPGLMLYGVSPFIGPGAVLGRGAEALDLEPVMTLAARVVATRRVARGESVGYGGTWRAARATTVATLPLGYADGIPRAAATGGGRVFLAGALRSIVGRASMDYIGVDVGDAAVEVGDVATVFGRTPEGVRVPVEDFASGAGTLGYEILVGIGARVPRHYGEGAPPAEPPLFDRAV
jgi:alanine racemase